jgi:signal transduction histidine kinase
VIGMQGWADRMAARLGSRVAPVDLAIAAGVLVACIYLPPAGRAGVSTARLDPADLATRGWDSLALVFLACLALVWRRQWPVPVWLGTLALAATDTLLTHLPSRCLPALLVAVYTVAVHTNRRTTLIVAAATAVTLIIPTLTVTGESIGSDATYALAAFSALAAAVGDSVRNQRASVESALARAEAAEASREEEARRRVAEERLRIARELHDAVAHHVSVINVQAGVASHLLEADPPAARTALVHVRAASQEVSEEMRVVVGLLRTDGNAQLVEPPTPGLTEIPGLVARMRSAGLDVELDDRMGARDLPTTTGLTAYRVIQEALTNAGKYGLGTARVVLEENGAMLDIEVSNPVAAHAGVPRRAGATGQAGGPDASGQITGHGLIGMRERVAAAGGTMTVTSDAVFQIRVDLPLHRVTR